MNNIETIKSPQISYKLLSKLPVAEKQYWIKRIIEKHIPKRNSKKHINWLKSLAKKLEVDIMKSNIL